MHDRLQLDRLFSGLSTFRPGEKACPVLAPSLRPWYLDDEDTPGAADSTMPPPSFFERLGDGDVNADGESAVALELEVSDIDAISKSKKATSRDVLEKQKNLSGMKTDLRWRAALSLSWQEVWHPPAAAILSS